MGGERKRVLSGLTYQDTAPLPYPVSLWLICSNQLSRPTFRRLANEPLSTGFVDRR